MFECTSMRNLTLAEKGCRLAPSPAVLISQLVTSLELQEFLSFIAPIPNNIIYS